jgi:hypothetical protein
MSTAPQQLQRAVNLSLRQEAERLRTEVVQGITRQAPGDEALEPPSELTLAARKLRGFGGTKSLMVRGDLRNAIAAIVHGAEAFVGVPRKARGKDGEPLVDVAQLMELGSRPIVIPITPAMRRFLYVLLKTGGKDAGSDGGGGGGGGRGVVVVQIPARPFLRPAFKKFMQGAQARFLASVARQLGW